MSERERESLHIVASLSFWLPLPAHSLWLPLSLVGCLSLSLSLLCCLTRCVPPSPSLSLVASLPLPLTLPLSLWLPLSLAPPPPSLCLSLLSCGEVSLSAPPFSLLSPLSFSLSCRLSLSLSPSNASLLSLPLSLSLPLVVSLMPLSLFVSLLSCTSSIG